MNATQDWNFDPAAILPPPGPKPTPRRFRKLLRREEENLASLRPGPAAPEADAPQTPAPPEGRDRLGRFAKGNQGGTGNPFARQVAGFRKALVDAVTEQDFAELAGVLLAQAKGGDLAAIKLLFAYTLGKPAETVDPDRVALEDFHLLRERLSTLEEDWHLIRKMVPVEGVTEAGHRVADLRAASWREEVLGQEGRPEPTGKPAAEGAAAGGRNPALLQEALAVVRAEPGAAPEWKARMERMLTEADEAGCLKDMLQKLDEGPAPAPKAAAGAGPQVPPSPPGGAAARAPSPNGGTAASTPSPNGPHGRTAPSPNGENGCARRRNGG